MKNKNLKILRKTKKVEVKDIATFLEISTSHYYKIEQGTRNPSLSLAMKISEYYDMDISKLF